MANREQPSLRQILYFRHIAELGSFRRAAEKLGITQPTMTAQIATLERMLGFKLFERSRHGVKLTPAARELLPNALRLEEEMQGFMDVAAGLTGMGSATYRMGVTPTLGPYLLPHVLPDLHRRYDSLRLYVREGTPAELASQLRQAQHDLILTTQPVSASEFEVKPLFRESLKLVLPVDHRLANKKRINRADLFGEQVLTIDEQHLYHRQISELCENLGATLRRDYEGTSLDTLRQMVVMGMGITFLPSLYIASEIRDNDSLRVTDVYGVSMYRHHALAWRTQTPARVLFRQLAERIVESVVERLGEHVQSEG
jgi:LysR family hydrogen peroxide-inducible transcriptional activator